jgi:hypothetical protein
MFRTFWICITSAAARVAIFFEFFFFEFSLLPRAFTLTRIVLYCVNCERNEARNIRYSAADMSVAHSRGGSLQDCLVPSGYADNLWIWLCFEMVLGRQTPVDKIGEGQLQAELEAERSKGFWQRLFGGRA